MIITVINQKGGTGKTTTVVNLGCALARKKNKVLLIDFDPQGNLSYSLGINEFDLGIREVLLEGVPLKDVVIERENVDVIPADRKLSLVELKQGQHKEPEKMLKKALKKGKKYDYVLVDCPPSLSMLTINALTATDQVIIPIQLDVFSIQGLEQILDTIGEIRSEYNKKMELMGVLPVLVDRRKKLTVEVKDHVQENFDVRMFKTEVRTNVKAAEAPSFGQSVVSYAPGSNSAKDYMAVAKEVIKMQKAKAK